jgi:hypothetical protein
MMTSFWGWGSSEFKNIFGFFVGTSLDPLTIDLERYFIKTHSFDFGPRLDRYIFAPPCGLPAFSLFVGDVNCIFLN